MDVDALTGGFNIQIALSTGAAAGDAIKEKATKARLIPLTGLLGSSFIQLVK